MSDWYNWKVAVDECHAKHIGPPPRLHRRIAYREAHRWTRRVDSPAPIFARLVTVLRRLVASTRCEAGSEGGSSNATRQ
jgi:hypothetical protein